MQQFFPRLKLWHWLVILGLTLTYLVVTCLSLTKLPMFVDEALYLRWAQIAGNDASWRFISLTDGKQPLFMWLAAALMRLVADPLVAGRLISVFGGLLALWGMGYAGWILGGKRHAFWAMIVTLFSPFLFFYNRFAVVEALMIGVGIWIFNLSLLLAKTQRLDIALLLGLVTGTGLLVKSPSQIYLLLVPVSYLLKVDFKHIFTKTTFKYLFLVLLSWVLAEGMYSIQRLSPWFYIIAQKNSFFIVPFRDIFSDWGRLFNNFLDLWRWHFAYTTLPVLLVAILGSISWLKKTWRVAIVPILWFCLALLATILVARLFSPRYMVFATPFLLLPAAYFLASIRSLKALFITLVLVFSYPTYLIGKLIVDPIHYPFVSLDEGYVNGWSAGNGTKQIADWAVARIKATGKPMIIYTEGTFGILPHGLELFTYGKVTGLTIEGIYPINEVPPLRTLEMAKKNEETYLIMNNTEVKGELPPTMKLVASYPKLRDNPMCLYQIIAPK